MRINKHKTLPALFVVGALALSGCASTATDASGADLTATGSDACPSTLRFSDTGVEGLETLVVEFENFRLAFAEATGKDIEFYPISSRTAASTALEFGEIDLLLTGPAEYVVLQQEAGALPVVGITRADYRSIIVARSDSNINALSDLNNKTVLTKEVGSTSGHLGPLEMLANAGLVVGETVDVVPLGATRIEAFGAGEGDALGTGLSDFEEIETELGAGSIKIVAEGPDLPNDLFIARSALGENCATWLQETLVENQQVLLDAITSTGENDKYLESEFLAAKDADYDSTRAAFVAAGFEDFAKLPE